MIGNNVVWDKHYIFTSVFMVRILGTNERLLFYQKVYRGTPLADLGGGLRGLQPPLWSENFTKKGHFGPFLGLQPPFPDRMVDKSTCSHERLQPPLSKISRSAYAHHWSVYIESSGKGRTTLYCYTRTRAVDSGHNRIEETKNYFVHL